MFTIYSAKNCRYCTLAKDLLKRHGAKIEVIDIYTSEAAAAEFTRRTNGALTVPQVFLDDRHIGTYEQLLEFSRTEEFQIIMKDI